MGEGLRGAYRRRCRSDAVRDLTALGYTISDIAAALGVSEASVERVQARLREAEHRIRRMAEAREEAGGRLRMDDVEG